MAPWLLHRVVFHAVHLVLVVYGVVAQWLARLSWPTLKTARTLDTHRLTRLRKAMVKPPPHVSVALTDPFELEDVARCVVGLALAGVRHISVWDHQGDALSHSIGLYEAVCKCQRQHGGSSSALFRGGLACPQVRPLPEGRVHSGTTLRIYGPEHGRSDVVNAVRSLAEGAVDPAALSRMTPEAFSRHLAYSSPEPDLLLKFGECDSLYGYPPWQLRVTEIISMPCVAHVSTEAIVACLAKYAATERRFGNMAAIFDMDGLMVDTEPLWQEAEMAVFAEVGVVLSREDCKQTTGLRIDEVVAHWHSVHPWDTAARPQADIVEGVINALIALIHARGELLPGVENAIGAMKECGLRLAVASSSSKRLINCVLDKFDLHKHFELYRSAEDEKYGKPHPGVYISAAEALGVEPVRCVALEDSFNGLLSAKAARMKTIAVPEPESRSQPRFVIADHQLASLEEVTADMIRALKLS